MCVCDRGNHFFQLRLDCREFWSCNREGGNKGRGEEKGGEKEEERKGKNEGEESIG